YTKSFLGATGNFYLSSIEETNAAPRIVQGPPVESLPQGKNNKVAVHQPPGKSEKPVVILKPPSQDIPQSAAAKLLECSERLDDIHSLLKGTKPQSDLLPMPKPKADAESPMPVSSLTASAKNEAIAEAMAHLQSESFFGKKNAPAITLINSQTTFNELGSGD